MLGALSACLRADSADDVWEVLSSMATGLGNGRTEEFLVGIDPKMPGYQDLRRNVAALVAQADLQSSIELVSNEGDDRKRKVEVDWLLRITGHDDVSGAANREEHVKAGFEKQGKHWRVISLEPIGFFAPPRAR